MHRHESKVKASARILRKHLANIFTALASVSRYYASMINIRRAFVNVGNHVFTPGSYP